MHSIRSEALSGASLDTICGVGQARIKSKASGVVGIQEGIKVEVIQNVRVLQSAKIKTEI